MEEVAVVLLIGFLTFTMFVVVRALTAERPARVDALESQLRMLSRRMDAMESGRVAPVAVGNEPALAPVAPSAPEPAPEPAPLAATHSAHPVHEARPLPKPGASPRRPQKTSLETFLGSRVMLVAGVIVLLFGIAFFLKYAIDHSWIAAGERIVMGVVLGVVLLVGGEQLRRRQFNVFGQALMGCGLGALYLSDYFACMRYAFIGTETAFILTACITSLGGGLALLRRAPFLAYLGFCGGFLAPALLAPHGRDLVSITRWLLLIDAGVLAVLLRRSWRGLDLLALLFTTAYVGAWFVRDTAARDIGTSSICLAALVLASLAMGLAPAIARRFAPEWESMVGVAAAGLLGAIAGHAILFPAHRLALGFGALELAGAYFCASVLLAKRAPGAGPAVESLLGFSVAAVALTVAITTSGSVVAPALSITGLALVFAGARTQHPILLAGGVATVAVAFCDLLTHRLPMFRGIATPFLSERFVVFACPCVALLIAGWLISRVKTLPAIAGTAVAAVGLLLLPAVLAIDIRFGIAAVDDFHRELRLVAPSFALAVYGVCSARAFGRLFPIGRHIALLPIVVAGCFGVSLFLGGHREAFVPGFNLTFAAGLVIAFGAGLSPASGSAAQLLVLRTLALVYLFGLITAEIHAWGATCPLLDRTRDEARFRASVWISIAWAGFATALVAIGFWRTRPALRWLGLSVFGLTVGKVFLADMAQLDVVYRIGSFLVLGALLLCASFLYQRSKAAENPEDAR